MTLLFLRTALLLATALPASSQARFEVASIRPSQPGLTARDTRHSFRGDRFEAKAMTVSDILDMLGGYQLFRVVDGPDWMRTERYDIEAKADQPLIIASQQGAVMALLAERFQLESHRETREVAGVVMRAARGHEKDVKPAGEGDAYSIRMEGGDVVFTAVPMSGLTNYLSQMLRAPLLDETQWKGTYNFTLPTSKVEPRPQLSWMDRVREAAEAIGIRLEDRRIPLEVTVVDRCEPPGPN